ncbi:MAG: peptidoglycan-binding protein, partial [Verrucomicrobia bacterium]|nr:peptidoglycan-binding protein [Verrucomicrobiota bacterium]
RKLDATTIAVVCLLTLPQITQAKDHDDDHGRGHDSKHHKSKHHNHDRSVYLSHPRSSFILSLGNGYAGRGYYYGPQNSPYYYERPDVRFYATREAAPREYYGQSYSNNSGDAAVQRALARRGYYQGSIDGELGPQSRRAIARYQADHGLRATGIISSSLLQSLGL